MYNVYWQVEFFFKCILMYYRNKMFNYMALNFVPINKPYFREVQIIDGIQELL